MPFNKPWQTHSLSVAFSTYHLEGILHRLRYLNCHRPKSYVCHWGGEIYSKFHRDTKLHSSIFTISSSKQHQPHQHLCLLVPFESFNCGDMKLMMTITTEITTKSYAKTTRCMHPPTKSNRITPNQFNFHFINDLIISPETVKCTRLPGISRNFDFSAEEMAVRMGKNVNKIDRPKNDIKSFW